MESEKKPILHVVNPRFPLFLALTVLSSALGFAFLQAGVAWCWLCFGAAAILVVFALLHCKTLNARLLSAIVAILIVAATGVSTAERVDGYRGAPVFYDTAVVEATIDNAPTATASGYTFHATELVLNGKRIRYAATVYVTTDESYWSRAEVGSRVRLEGVSLKKKPMLSGGTVDYGVFATPYTVSVREGSAVLLSAKGGGAFARLRYRLINAVRSRFTDTLSGVALALLIGDKSLLPDEAYAEFRLTGIAHALAVSGLHVGFLLSVIAFFTRRLGHRGRIAGLAVTALIVFSYATLCGFTPGVTRACIMGVLSQLASVLGRRTDSLNNLSLAALFMLAFDPMLVTDLGFALSFASVVGIVLLMPPLRRLFRKLRLPEWLGSGIAVTTASSVAVLPLIAAYFHTLSVWSILENLLASPLIEFIFIVLLACALLAVATGWFAILDLAGYVLQALKWFTGVCARLPFADFVIFPLGATIPFFVLALLFCGGIVLVRKRKWRIATASVMSAMLVVLIVVSNLAPAIRTDKVCVTGSTYSVSASVATSEGTVVLGRVDSFTVSRLENVLIAERIRKVDVLVVTKADFSDLAAVRRFARRFSVDTVLVDYGEGATDLATALGKGAQVLLDAPVRVGKMTVASTLASGNIRLDTTDRTYLYAEDSAYPSFTADVVLCATPSHASAGVLCIAGSAGEGTLPENAIVRFGEFLPVG